MYVSIESIDSVLSLLWVQIVHHYYIANLFLFYYEYKYMKNLIKNNIILAKKFNNTMRYIDDLLKLNNTQFDTAIQDIYPQELQLKKTTESATALSYLDVFITIDNGRYSTAVFDKRDSFTFNIVNFPHLNSNIPSKPAYGVYISQLVRIGRICSNFVQFKLRHYTLTQKLMKQEKENVGSKGSESGKPRCHIGP